MITPTTTNKSTYLEQNYEQFRKIIKKNNKSSYLTENKTLLKETPTSKINEEDNSETMDTSFKHEEDKYLEMTLES